MMKIEVKEDVVKTEERDEECVEIPPSSSSDDEDKVNNIDIKKAKDTQEAEVKAEESMPPKLSDNDQHREDFSDEDYNNIGIDSEGEDEGALQRSDFLSSNETTQVASVEDYGIGQKATTMNAARAKT